jgi:hypothetical protein
MKRWNSPSIVDTDPTDLSVSLGVFSGFGSVLGFNLLTQDS